VMVDDDFRLLGGRKGCYCPLHLEAIGRRLGRPDLRVIAPPAAQGFGAAANEALRLAQLEGHDRLLLLNDDAWLEPGARALLLAAVATPGVAMAGAVLLREDGVRIESAGLRVRLGGGRVVGDPDAPPRDGAPRPVDALPATAVALRLGPVLASGGFDEQGFPMYFEDVDLSLRLRHRGYRLLLVPGARAVHRGAATAGRGSELQAYHQARGQWVLSHRHGGWPEASVAAALSAAALLRAGEAPRPARAVALARGLRDALTSAPVDERYRVPPAANAAENAGEPPRG